MLINRDADIYDFLSDMQKDVFNFFPIEFEKKWYTVCCDLSGLTEAKKIEEVDFSLYKNALSEGFISVFNHEFFLTSKAIYFEYDLDNDWQSSFFVCNEYNPEAFKDEDWACDWAGDSIEGPDFPLLSSLYSEKRFDTFDATPRSKGITLYLVAKTVSSFMTVVKHLPDIDKTICIGFHDQDSIMRARLSRYDK